MTAALPQFTWAEVCARRLARHSLLTPAPDAQPAAVVGAICGAHAQILSAAELSIALRLPNATRADIRAALWDDRSLVKTFGPRGTVHLLPTRDLPLWTGALSALPSGASPFPADVRLSPEQTDLLVAAIGEVLADAELTVDELTAALVGRVGAWAGELVMPAFQTLWPRWRQITDTAAHRGALCFGPNRGRKVTYTSPRRRCPGFQPAEGQAALAALLKRYLYAYGPATPQHFAQWLAMPHSWAVTLFARLADTLQEVDVDGSRAWIVAGDTTMPSATTPSLHLLPYFDAYAVGSHPRDRVYPGKAADRALNGGQSGNFPVLLLDGAVAGVWHQRRSGRKLALTVEPLTPLTAAQRRELDVQVARVGAILEGAPELTIGPVTVGPHA